MKSVFYRVVLVASLASVLPVRAGEVVVSTDGLSPREALLKIRAAKKAGDESAWTVRVKKGTYRLSETLAFGKEDSGMPKAPVRWIGESGAVFSGGGRIDGWRDTGRGWWEAPIPKDAAGRPVYFDTLYANGRRAERSRLPDKGYLTLGTDGVNTPVTNNGAVVRWEERIVLTNAAARAAMAALTADELAQAQLLIVNKWAFGRRIPRAYDAATGTVLTYGESWPGWKRWTVNDIRFWIENVRAGFDAPGEWFYDAADGKVLYRPLSGETLDAFVAEAPLSKLSELCTIDGASDLSFENLTFEIADATGCGAKPVEVRMLQAASFSSGAWTVAHATRCLWKDCTIRRTNNYGMRFNNGVTHCQVVNCLLEDLGAGGVWMGADRGYVASGERLSRRIIRTPTPKSTGFNLISNCTIRAGGLYNREGTGVALTHCSDTTVTHCDIGDLFYTGVSVGWVWGYSGSVAQRNTVSFNCIHDLGKYQMADMGGVYTLGTSFGTCVSNNVIWNVKSYSYGGWALYNDEGSEDVVMENNLCYDTYDAGYHQHYGVDNLIRNNIFAINEKENSVRTSRTPVQGVPSSVHFVNNIVYTENDYLVYGGVTCVGGVWAHNLWFTTRGRGQVVRRGQGWKAGSSWDDFVASGREIGGLFADPKFADVAKRDFRLKEDSPAFALGFRPFDPTKAGLTGPCGAK